MRGAAVYRLSMWVAVVALCTVTFAGPAAAQSAKGAGETTTFKIAGFGSIALGPEWTIHESADRSRVPVAQATPARRRPFTATVVNQEGKTVRQVFVGFFKQHPSVTQKWLAGLNKETLFGMDINLKDGIKYEIPLGQKLTEWRPTERISVGPHVLLRNLYATSDERGTIRHTMRLRYPAGADGFVFRSIYTPDQTKAMARTLDTIKIDP
jgi:hypothetical protein